MPEKIVAVILAYNEQAHIGKTLQILNGFKAKGLLQEMVVVNDGSSDKTAEIASKAGAIVVSHRKNMGKRRGFISGALEARRLKATVMLSLDADILNFPEASFRQMVSEITEKGKLMAVARQYEKTSVPGVGFSFEDDAEFLPVKEKYSNAQRALSMKALDALFTKYPNPRRKWYSILTAGFGKSFNSRSPNSASFMTKHDSKWGLEFALDSLIPKGKQAWLDCPVFTDVPFRRGASKDRITSAQEGGRQLVKFALAERILKAASLRRQRSLRK